MNITKTNTLLGSLWIGADDTHVLRISYTPLSGKKNDTPLLKQAKTEIREYMHGKRQVFTIPFRYEGSSFQQDVWNVLQTIPYGSVWRYVDVAEILGDRDKSRAVGGACRSNPLPIIIPCHRVVGILDSGGYVGGVINKKKLISLETMATL